jgi:hypothetical protein
MTYHNIYSNASLSHSRPPDITVPQASHVSVEELPIAFSVGTGVSYLSARPIPLKAWVGAQPSPNRPLQSGVCDSGGSTIIDKRLVPNSYTILESPMKPVFGGLSGSKTQTLGYAVLPVYFPNAVAISGDDRSARIAKVWLEFQVVDDCPAGFLVGMDTISAYKMSIEVPKGFISLNAFNPPFRIPIADETKYSSAQVDPRIYSAEVVKIRPFSEV